MKYIFKSYLIALFAFTILTTVTANQESKQIVHSLEIDNTVPVTPICRHAGAPTSGIAAAGVNIENTLLTIPPFDQNLGKLTKVEIRTKNLTMNGSGSGTINRTLFNNVVPQFSGRSQHILKISLIRDESFVSQFLLREVNKVGLDTGASWQVAEFAILLPETIKEYSDLDAFKGSNNNQLNVEITAESETATSWMCNVVQHNQSPYDWVCAALTASGQTTVSGALEVIYTYTPKIAETTHEMQFCHTLSLADNPDFDMLIPELCQKQFAQATLVEYPKFDQTKGDLKKITFKFEDFTENVNSETTADAGPPLDLSHKYSFFITPIPMQPFLIHYDVEQPVNFTQDGSIYKANEFQNVTRPITFETSMTQIIESQVELDRHSGSSGDNCKLDFNGSYVTQCNPNGASYVRSNFTSTICGKVTIIYTFETSSD